VLLGGKVDGFITPLLFGTTPVPDHIPVPPTPSVGEPVKVILRASAQKGPTGSGVIDTIGVGKTSIIIVVSAIQPPFVTVYVTLFKPTLPAGLNTPPGAPVQLAVPIV